MAKYKKAYAKKLIEYGEQGKTFSRFCADVGIHRSAGYKWIDRHPEFGEAKKMFDTSFLANLEDITMAVIRGEAQTNYGVLKLMLQSVSKDYRQNTLNVDVDDVEKKPTQLNITFTEAKKEEDE